MKQSKTTQISDEASGFFKADQAIPGLLVAYAPLDSILLDRFIVTASFDVGRDPSAQLPIDDSKVSKRHLTFTMEDENKFFIEDVGSTNGTFVNGKPVLEVDLKDGDQIVAGMSVFTIPMAV